MHEKRMKNNACMQKPSISGRTYRYIQVLVYVLENGVRHVVRATQTAAHENPLWCLETANILKMLAPHAPVICVHSAAPRRVRVLTTVYWMNSPVHRSELIAWRQASEETRRTFTVPTSIDTGAGGGS